MQRGPASKLGLTWGGVLNIRNSTGTFLEGKCGVCPTNFKLSRWGMMKNKRQGSGEMVAARSAVAI